MRSQNILSRLPPFPFSPTHGLREPSSDVDDSIEARLYMNKQKGKKCLEATAAYLEQASQ